MTPRLRILHLEDSQPDSELIGAMLTKEGFECEIRRCESRHHFLENLEKKEVDLIIADCALPNFSGFDALEICRKVTPEIPFIFVSGTMGEETAIESLHKGATDYVLKQRLSRLVPAVRRALAEAAERNKNRDMEERLRQAQRLEAVGTLAGGVAHDFNNILTIIKGHISLLFAENVDPGRVREIGETIDRAAQRGTDLIKQLLAFARKSDSTFIYTQVNQQVTEIAAMLREAFPRNITFHLRLDPDAPKILADPGQIERVLINLATNARDAMPLGGKITISTGMVEGAHVPFVVADEQRQSYLLLRVTDNGSGMDEATRRHLFEPFFTTKPKGQGTGLGMPVVYGLMQSHNGVIDVWSEPGRGTAISLYFPVPETCVPEPAEGTEEKAAHVRGTETVLIVDDESDVRYFLKIILEMHGYKVFSAANAEEALEMLRIRGREVDVLFSDIGLQELDGFGLSIEVRKLHPQMKIILSSGYLDGAIRTRMAELNINGFLSKPYEMPVLLESLRSVLDKAVA